MTDTARPGRVWSPRFTRTIDWLVPPLCLACHKNVSAADQLCAACWRDLRFITAPLCDRLGIPLNYDTGGTQVSAEALASPPDYDRARAAVHFAGPARRLVHRLKYQDSLEPRRLLARWLTVAGEAFLQDADVIVPVPLNRWRLFGRRFNQAALLAVELERQTKVKYAPLALERRRNTPQQVGLTAAQRTLNVRGAFRVPAAHKADIEARHVLLIDDVITTGATINACARALQRAGAASVNVLAVAMTTELSRTLA